MNRVMLKPKWEYGYEQWARKWVCSNFDRVRYKFHEKEDAVQECWILFNTCERRYHYENAAHLMALFKTTVKRQWLDWTREQLQHAATVADLSKRIYAVELPDQELYAAWGDCSWELRKFLTLLADASVEVRQELFARGSVLDIDKRWKTWCGIRTRRNIRRELAGLKFA